MSFTVRKPGVPTIEIPDLGITINSGAAAERDLRDESPQDIAESTDLQTLIAGTAGFADAAIAAAPAGSVVPGVATQNWEVDVTIDGGGLQQLAIAVNIADDYDTIAATLSAAITGGTCAFVGGAFRITSDTANASSSVVVADGTLGVTSGLFAAITAAAAGNPAITFPAPTAGLAAELIILDPRDNTTALSSADGEKARSTANDAHFGVNGGVFATLDAPGASLNDGDIVSFSAGSGEMVQLDPATLISNESEAIEDIVGAMGISGSDSTFTYNDTNGTIVWEVDDSFLRNNGDTLDSGSLDIASGASISVLAGGDLTIVDAPVNPTDATNKAYVDSVAAGLDPKESVRYASIADVSGTYVPAGGTGGTGQFTAVDLTNVSIWDGLAGGALIIGDRILVKDQVDLAGFATAVVSGAPAGSVVPGLTGATYDFDTTVDGGGNQALSIVIAGGEDYDAIAALMDAQIVGGSIAFSGGAFVVTSDTTGASSAATVAAGTAASGGGDLFAAIDTAATVTTTFPAATAGEDHAIENGIYVVTTAGAAGVIERSPDMDGSPANEVSAGNFTFVEQGSALANTGWVVSGDGVLTLNTDPINWVQFNSSASFTAGAGLGLSGNEFFLDIDNLGAETIVGTDEIAFNDVSDGAGVTKNTTVTNFISDLGLQTDAYATIGGDTGSASATGADSINLIGATTGGITTIASEPGTDQVTFSITPFDLATGGATLASGDFIVVADSADTASTVGLKYTFGTMISDLGILTGISAATDEDLLGIDVTGTVIGLDILGLTNPAEDMAATDEFAVHNKSEGTAGANRKIDGQEIADGTATILGIGGLTFSTFTAVTTPGEDQTGLTMIDASRASKVLSVETTNYEFSDNKIKDNDWFKIGKAGHADSGYIMPFAGTIIGAAAHSRDTGAGNTWDLDVYIDAVDTGAVIGGLTGGADVSDSDPTLNLDFTAGQKIRIRADNTAGGGDMKDTTITLYVKWLGT